ncbi:MULTISPECIES: hypothetical protein [unclassified Neisseria]|uniref:hypothetical protein n=1 Tax=unclassified Neisseria TaxID=2623750 RepID=UPI001071A123|nr:MULTISPECIES: hypothetical protein [unclassified Neisseria]MBF0802849.1 hypothetical protein [Neisseria sp. 19428wB4_WF04]TFU44631.1 hypothetical protein E4T99_00435 [Neisseria sp. WF04]
MNISDGLNEFCKGLRPSENTHRESVQTNSRQRNGKCGKSGPPPLCSNPLQVFPHGGKTTQNETRPPSQNEQTQQQFCCRIRSCASIVFKARTRQCCIIPGRLLYNAFFQTANLYAADSRAHAGLD